MRYKTRKYIKKFILYTINTGIFLVLYSYAAQKNYLPAFFEYYTGEKVRSLTAEFYGKVSGDKSIPETKSFDFYNTLDFLVREPVYLYIKDTFLLMEKEKDDVSQKIKDDAVSIGTHPALIEWLRNLRGQFSSIYQYEILRYIDHLDSINNYIIIDSAGKVVFAKGKFSESYDTLKQNKEFSYYDGMISIPVNHDNKIIGRVIATVDKSWNVQLDFMNTGYDISYLLLSKSNEVLKSQGFLNQQIQDNKYRGPKNGRSSGIRFLTKPVKNNILVIAYPAESILYYIFKIFVYLAVAVLIFIFIEFWRRGGLVDIFEKFFGNSRQVNMDNLLVKSNQVNQEYAAMAVKFQNSLQVMKGQEIDRLRIISEHLTYLHQSMNKAIEDGIGEVKNIDKV